ncbi:sugar phosphate isomerase/epimerase family protein, partial [uncultured Methylobacterium sp.]|uniref:sugar phosphate isomerase/epimerase family protein n=1 Tax=uncultured Methylobacterium sp. TaxID=157278 RepID=UPI0035CB8527
MSLRFAYNTNGAANHRLDDAIDLIAEAGYDGVALTLDIHHLDPFADGWVQHTERVASRLQRLGLGSVIETGARFLLDPRAKHEPTLVTADASARLRRVGFLMRAIDIAGILGSEAVSFWAGVPKTGVDHGSAKGWLREGLADVVAYAGEQGVVPCLEPEPGMLIETLDDFAALDVPGLRLALDTGHCLVTQEREPA